MSNMNPIHWECSIHPPENAKVIDLRTLPEEVKVAIIKSAIEIGYRYHNGEYGDLTQDSNEDAALAALTESVERIDAYMHPVKLTICP